MRSVWSLASLLALLSAAPCFADYSPPPLFDMVGSSDLVLVGTITKIGEATFVLGVETVVAGKLEAKTIEVTRYVDWTCSTRWTPYAERQRVLLCLTTTKGKPAKIRSAGGEGEMPVIDSVVYYRGFPIDTIAAAAPHVIGDKTLHGQQVKLETFVAAIQGYRRCFRLQLSRSGYPQLKSLKQTAADAEVNTYTSSSPLAAFLAKSTRSAAGFEKAAAGADSVLMRKEPRRWTRSELLAITDAKARALNYDPESMSVSFDTFNKNWKRYAGDPPARRTKLEGRTFWAVHCRRLRPTKGGELWIFVDRETRKILTVEHGE